MSPSDPTFHPQQHFQAKCPNYQITSHRHCQAAVLPIFRDTDISLPRAPVGLPAMQSSSPRWATLLPGSWRPSPVHVETCLPSPCPCHVYLMNPPSTHFTGRKQPRRGPHRVPGGPGQGQGLSVPTAVRMKRPLTHSLRNPQFHDHHHGGHSLWAALHSETLGSSQTVRG